jgi:hypothetical protein
MLYRVAAAFYFGRGAGNPPCRLCLLPPLTRGAFFCAKHDNLQDYRLNIISIRWPGYPGHFIRLRRNRLFVLKKRMNCFHRQNSHFRQLSKRFVCLGEKSLSFPDTISAIPYRCSRGRLVFKTDTSLWPPQCASRHEAPARGPRRFQSVCPFAAAPVAQRRSLFVILNSQPELFSFRAQVNVNEHHAGCGARCCR